MRVLRRELNVGDKGVLRVVGVNFTRRDAGDDLILPDAGERMAAEGGRPGQDLDVRNACLCNGRCNKHGGGQKACNTKSR